MSRAVPIGALRHRVTLEAPVDTPDDAGGFSRSFAQVASLWARIVPVAAQDQFVEQQQEQSLSHLVTIRWRADVRSQMRFVHRGRKLLIHSAHDPDERRRFVICRCEELS